MLGSCFVRSPGKLVKDGCPQRSYRFDALPMRGTFDTRSADAVEAEGVLQATEFTIGIAHWVSQCLRDETKFGGDAEQRDIAEVAAQAFVGMGMAEDKVLDDEFDVDQPAGILFDLSLIHI